MRRFLSLTLVLISTLPLAAQEAEQEKPEFRGQNAKTIAAWLKVSQDHAADYQFTFESRPDAPLKLLPKAVFRHSQPVRGDDIGAVYLWVDDAGLPSALGTVFAYSYGGPGERWVAHEFHSLASEPLVGDGARRTRGPPPSRGWSGRKCLKRLSQPAILLRDCGKCGRSGGG